MPAPFCPLRLMTSHLGVGYSTVSGLERARPGPRLRARIQWGNRRRPAGRVADERCGVLSDACGLEQLLRGFEVGGGEPLGEAGVDRGQEVARRRGPSLLLP